MKNRAVWVALVVLAVAALLMFFVVLPQMRQDKTAEQLAGKAADSVEQAKDAAKKTADEAGKAVDTAKTVVEQAADQAKATAEQAAADVKAGALAKMARIRADVDSATGEFQALLAASKAPTTEQLAAARARIEAALKAAAELKAQEGLDKATADMIAKASQGAEKALGMIRAMPADVEGAKKALDSVKTSLLTALGSEDTQASGEQPSADKTAAEAALPAFDVLRVEPDGSTVIAGRALPGTKIDVLDGDKVIASADAGVTGDFVAVLDNPLAAGDHQLVLQATGKDGKKVASLEVATVSVPADKSGELLAMVTKPGEASRIMTMPEAKTNPELAQTDKSVAKAGQTEAKAGTEAGAETEVKPADTAKADKAGATSDLSAAAGDVSGAAQNEAKATDAGSDATTAGSNSAEVKSAAPEVVVSAVEIEGDKIFIAGSTRPKSVVRVYADDKLVSEVSTDENGRFVADNVLPLAVGEHTIRADVLSGDGKKVEYRASVPFFRPEGEQLAAVAGDAATTDAMQMQPLADGAYDKAREEAGKALSLLKGLYDAGKMPTSEELAAARSATEIALKTLSDIKLADDTTPAAKDMASKTAGEAAKALAMLKALPQDAKAVKSALGAIDDAVTSAVAPSIGVVADSKPVKPADQDTGATATSQQEVGSKPSGEVASKTDAAAGEETAKTSEVAAADEQAAATADNPKVIKQAPLTPSGSSVIIRRGDTLWQISRRVYGKGVRYTTIYLANEEQIANPDRIMPGQIFGVPEKYLPNAEELHRERLDHRKR